MAGEIMSEPTEPGFYWAWWDKEHGWQPVEVYDGRNALEVWTIGSDRPWLMSDFKAWGPRIRHD